MNTKVSCRYIGEALWIKKVTQQILTYNIFHLYYIYISLILVKSDIPYNYYVWIIL